MMHGCTEPSSTLHPYAFAIAAHNMTDPMGPNANATMTNSASIYHSHGNLLCGLPFMTAIPNHRLRANILARVFKISDLLSLLNDPLLLGPVPKRGELGWRIVRFLQMEPGGLL